MSHDPVEVQQVRRWSVEERAVGPPTAVEPWRIRQWPAAQHGLPLPSPRPEAPPTEQRVEAPAREPSTAPEKVSDLCPHCMAKGAQDGRPFVKASQAA